MSLVGEMVESVGIDLRLRFPSCPTWGLNPRVAVSRGVMGVSDWGNKGSVIEGDVDVVISCGGGSDGGSIAGIE